METTTTIIISVIILIVLFLILRELMCWYWKINVIVKIAETQTILLQKILDKMNTDSLAPQDETIQINTEQGPENFSSIPGINQNAYKLLSDKEKEEANRFLDFGIKEGQVLAINKKSRKIDRYDEKEWKQLEERLEGSEWTIICRK